ncbi:MAG: hypothetical protein WC476_08015 [Phycisphaerae bacterium]|jgi:hypothetical protein
MKIKFKVISFCIVTLFFSLTISPGVIVAEEQQWKPVPETDYADVLELIEIATKANYDGISSWQGQLDILETKHHYGSNAVKMANADPNSIAHNSQHILETIKSTARFIVDLHSGKLHSDKEKPQVQLKAVDLNQDVPVRKNGEYKSVRANLTREQYMWYMPDSNFVSKMHNVQTGKMVFVDRPEERKFSLSGDIRDPRIFFESSGEDDKKLWETLLRIRSNIDDRIKERVGSFPHIAISSLETDKGIKYRILTTWRSGENYYVRSLLEVDEAVGFNAVKTETTNPDGVKKISKEYTYEKIGEIYLPKTVKRNYRNNKNEPTFTSEITVETTGLNKPLSEDTFTIKTLGAEENTLVTDKIKNAEFRYSEGKLVPIADLSVPSDNKQDPKPAEPNK